MDCITLDMASRPEKDESEQAFQARIKLQMVRERERKGWSQQTTADFLGISKANYEKYEGLPRPGSKAKPRKVPTTLMLKFCCLMELDVGLFMVGNKNKKQARRAS